MCLPAAERNFLTIIKPAVYNLMVRILVFLQVLQILGIQFGETVRSIPGSFSLILSESVQSEQADNANTEKAASAIPLNDFLYNFIIIQHLLLLFACPPYVSSHVVRSTQIAVYCLLHVFSITCYILQKDKAYGVHLSRYQQFHHSSYLHWLQATVWDSLYGDSQPKLRYLTANSQSTSG